MLVKNAKFVFDPLDGKVKDCARKSKSLHISHALSYFINLNLIFVLVLGRLGSLEFMKFLVSTIFYNNFE